MDFYVTIMFKSNVLTSMSIFYKFSLLNSGIFEIFLKFQIDNYVIKVLLFYVLYFATYCNIEINCT